MEEIEQLTNRESIRVRILGDNDPRTLSREEFESSRDALFHGSARDFTFYQSFDYRALEYLQDRDGSTTLGVGFYTTSDR